MKVRLSTKTVLGIIACLFSLYAIYFYSTTTYPNTVLFQGDEVDYQPMALNFARGHGLLRPGNLEPNADYKFVIEDQNIGYIDTFFNGKNRDEWKFTRNPGWPVVLGVIYMVFGNNPVWAYRMEMLFLIISAVSLTWIGWKCWGKQGVWAGIPAGFVFLNLYREISERPLTEPLMILMLSLVFVWFIRFKEPPTRWRAVVMGLLLSFSLLVKGSFLFLPVLFPIYALLIFHKKLTRKKLLDTMGFLAIGIVIPLAIWSTYASIKDGQFLFLSHQGQYLLQSGNNELTILQHGGWQKNWYKHENMFYNQPDIKDLPITKQVVLFYFKFYRFIPRIIQNKLHVGFINFSFIKAFLLFYMLKNLFLIYRRSGNFHLQKTFVFLFFSGMAIFSYFEVYTLFVLSGAMAAFLMVSDQKRDPLIPAPFFLFLANTVLITLMFFGEERFTYVIDGFFILLCTHAFVYLAESLWKEARKNFPALHPIVQNGFRLRLQD